MCSDRPRTTTKVLPVEIFFHVPMEVEHMVHQEATVVPEDMVDMVGLEAWVVVAALAVGARGTTLMENDHRFIAVF